MSNIENILQNSSEQEVVSDNKIEEISLSKLIKNETEELNELTTEIFEGDSILVENNELEKLDNEEKNEINDWKETSEAIILNNETEKVNESWKRAAEERFGFKDFDLDNFKRIVFNDKAVSDNFLAGRDWEYIYNNMDDFFEGYSYEMATKSFEVMQSLEDKNPGSVKILHEKFGITNFQRYPEDILLNQIKNEETNKNIGLLAFAESDPNGAFDNQLEIWNKVCNNQKDNLDFKIIECGSNIDLMRQLISLKQNNNQKIDLAFLSAHSHKDSFYLSDNDSIDKDDIVKYSSEIKNIFSDKAQLVANACSSAALGGWVNRLSKEAHIQAVGPDHPAGIIDVDFVGKEVVPIYHEIDSSAYKKYHNGFLLSK